MVETDCPHLLPRMLRPLPKDRRNEPAFLPHIVSALEDRASPRVASAAPTAAPTYARKVPKRTLLCALVQAHYPNFIARLAAEDRSQPGYVRPEFEACAAACSTTASCAWCASSAMRNGCWRFPTRSAMSSITDFIATGAQAGSKLATLQTIPADTDALEGDAGSATAPCVALPPTSLSAKVGGFSLHNVLLRTRCLLGPTATTAALTKSVDPTSRR